MEGLITSAVSMWSHLRPACTAQQLQVIVCMRRVY